MTFRLLVGTSPVRISRKKIAPYKMETKLTWRLSNVEDEALQVLGLGEGQSDRMIVRLR